MNKTAYLLALSLADRVILYVCSTTGGVQRARQCFDAAYGFGWGKLTEVIVTQPDSQAQRMINTAAVFTDGITVKNLRQNRISNDEAAQANYTCGLSAAAIRAVLKKSAAHAKKEAQKSADKAQAFGKLAGIFL